MKGSPVVLYRPNLAVTDDKALIAELVGALTGNGAVSDATAFTAAVWEREAQQRTWLGREAALPHARIADVKQLTLVLGTHPKGIPWGEDDQVARLFFLVAVPPNGGVDYLYLNQRITRTLRDDSRRAGLLKARDEKSLAEAWRAGS